MKKDIHPKYFSEAKVTCACGNKFTTGSTMETINIEVCSACHPFYTGKQKLLDTAQRVDKFKKKVEVAAKSGKVISKVAKKAKQKKIQSSKKAKVETEK